MEINEDTPIMLVTKCSPAILDFVSRVIMSADAFFGILPICTGVFVYLLIQVYARYTVTRC